VRYATLTLAIRPGRAGTGAGYGEVRLQIPVFRCGQCRRMACGMTLLGGEMRYLRFSKKTMTSPSAWRRAWLSYARAGEWVGCVKSTVCQWLRKAPLAVPELPPDGTLELDGLWTRTRRGRAELKVIRAAAAGTALGAFGPWAEVMPGLAVGGAASAASVVPASPAAEVSAEHWDIRICGDAAAAECGQSGGRSGMGAANYAGDGWGGTLLV